MKKIIIATGAILAATAFAGAAAAGTGCNGVINQLEWGCAAWDNNNGPQFPHWKGAPARAATPVPASSMVRPNNLVAAGGGNLVAAGGGNLVAAGGGNLVAAGGGNLRGK